MRGDEPIDGFVRSSPSVGNLNSYPVDRPVYVFLRPGGMPNYAVARDGELAHVMYVAENIHCYLVDDLGPVPMWPTPPEGSHEQYSNRVLLSRAACRRKR
jgi:hypothetical protein